MKPKILFVALAHSIHTARWIKQLNDSGFEIHVFPSTENGYSINPELEGVTMHGLFVKPKKYKKDLKFYRAICCPFSEGHILLNRILTFLFKKYFKAKNDFEFRSILLKRAIKKIKPEIIHILEMQQAGYLVASVLDKIDIKRMPKIIYTPWGSDIYYYRKLEEHICRIKSTLEKVNYYWPKSQRDIKLALEFDYKGKFLPILPGNGGYKTDDLKKMWSHNLVSDRRKIMVKGYQGFAGRALFTLKAIEKCSEYLKNYEIILNLASDDVSYRAKMLSKDKDLKINIISNISHLEMMRLYGQSRISISASISDGVPNSMLESMVMGCFPIESIAGCANEFIKDGCNGLIIDAEDIDGIANAIKKAVSDDKMVNLAAEINYSIIREKLEYVVVKEKVVKTYNDIIYDNYHYD
jgi:glycosyltransferase involved in cell wall biosynthesis